MLPIVRLLNLIVISFFAVVGLASASGDVREAAEGAGYGPIAKRLADASLPTVFVRPRPFGPTPATLGTSRTGGAPDLPPGTRWPRCKGQPQSFLAQIRVRDLPPQAAELRRAGGSLDQAVDFVAADAGRIQFLISPADLRSGRFDRVCGVFDSA
jgi:hypothetical protein